jgi:CRP/FNR family transcriptional regulator, polysaccharide utilization system transcription regulator
MATFTKGVHCTTCNLKMNIFCHLNDGQIEYINKDRFEVHFHKGEVIFKQGGPLTHIACLTTGLAKIYIEGKDKKNMILKILKPSELVAGPGFAVDYRHHYSVSALADSSACLVDIRAFEDMIKANSEFAFQFIKYRNQKTISLHARLMSLTHKQMHGRIADTLLYLSKEIYQSSSFETPLTRQDIADMSAMTKESAIRILKELKDDNIIDFTTSGFKILNETSLIQISITG